MSRPSADFTKEITEDTKRRFWEKVDKRGGCWLWRASIAVRFGYGQFGIGTRVFAAHRVSFAITHGRMPNGILLHTCDNPPCVNPEHLREGTYKDNTQDMIAKGRAGFHKIIGKNNGNAKLSNQEVYEILEKYDRKKGNAPQLAKEYNVTPSLIYMILSGQRRKYLTGNQEYTVDGTRVIIEETEQERPAPVKKQGRKRKYVVPLKGKPVAT